MCFLFKENSLHTAWFSLKQYIKSRKLYVKHATLPADEALEQLLLVFEERQLEYALRFDLSVDKDKTAGYRLYLRALPTTADYANDDSRLNSDDVAAIQLFSMSVSTYILGDSFTDIREVIPSAPIIFMDQPFTLESYKSIVMNIFPAIMVKFRVFTQHTFDSAKSYLQDTKAQSGNHLRYAHLPNILTKKNPLHQLNVTAGTARVSKFGPKFSLRNYAPAIPLFLMNFICLHLASSTWDSYKSSWNAYFGFIKHAGYGNYLPASVDILSRYVNFLKSWKNLRVSTIRSYLSGLKKLHMLNHCHTSQFDDPLLLFYLSGLKNWENSVVLPSLQRNVMTFATLKIWGHAICCSNLSYFDQQVLWTGMYIFHFFFFLLIFFLQFFISF